MHKDKDGRFSVPGVDPETFATLTEGYYDDRTDPKWAHPDLIAGYTLFADQRMCDGNSQMNDPSLTREERIAVKTNLYKDILAAPLPENDKVVRTLYTIKGLNEGDPNIPVYVVKPVNFKRKKSPVLFGIGQGGMLANNYNMLWSIMEPLILEHNVTLVYVEARTGIECDFPAPIDEYQAGYQWMQANAEELDIDPDNVAVYGDSGGGYTGLCFAFRCKRVGLKPKGFLIKEPIVDDRMCFPSNRIIQGGWDAADIHRTFMTIVGRANAFSPFLGPEVVPGHATVDDCKGLAPIFLHTLELDPDRDACLDFVRKLYEAKVYAQFHSWAGAAHGAFHVMTDSRIKKVFDAVCYTELADMFAYDFRRDW